MRQCHKDRLLTLAKYLTKVNDDNFDIGTFMLICNSFSAKVTAQEYRDEPCGTIGCAIGYACLVPEFNKLGLNIKYGNPNYTTKTKIYYGFAAAEKFFGISRYICMQLFDSIGYKNRNDVKPKDVAREIKRFLKEQK